MEMSSQGELFRTGARGRIEPRLPPAKHLARRTDPATSHDAARGIVGSLGRLQAEALAAIRRHPAHTATELADLAGIRDPRVLNRRISELAADGRIVCVGERACRVTGRRARIWEVGNGD